MKILMLTPYVPYPLFSGGQIRTYNLVKQLSDHHEFTLVCFYRQEEEKQHEGKLKEIFQNVYFIKKKKPWSIPTLVKSLGRLPLLLTMYDSHTAKNLLKNLLKSSWDIIHVEPFYVMHNLLETGDPLLLVEHNIEYLAYERFVNNQKIPLLKMLMKYDVAKMRKWEESSWIKANKVIAVSENDKQVMEKAGIKNVSVIPNGVDLQYFQFSPRKRDGEKRILFVGDFKWFPNIEAVTFLKEQLWPKIRENFKDKKIKLLIVGKFVPNKIKKWAKEDIEVKENILDIRVAYQSSDVLLAPLWSGGGTKYKILEAMATGCPVVTTPLGCEGLKIKDGVEVLIGASGEELTEKTLEILNDKNLAESLRKNAREAIEQNYSWNKMGKDIDNIYQSF